MVGGIGSSLGTSRLHGMGRLGAATSAQSRAAQGRGQDAITLKTQEGDTVTITRKASASATYDRTGSGGSLASLGLQSNDEFDVQIQGNLSDQERSDIQATLQELDSARTSFDSGDASTAASTLQSAMAGGGTVASVAGPGGGPPPGGGGAGKASGSGSSNSAVSILTSGSDSDSDSDSTSWATKVSDSDSSSSTSSSSSSTSISTSWALSSSNSDTTESVIRKALAGLQTASTASAASSASAA